MLFNKHKYTFNASKKILHKIKKRWVVISLALLGIISGVALATSPINVNADNNGVINQSRNITQQANQLHSRLMNNNVNNRQSTMKLGAESNDNNWNFFSDSTPNYSDSYSYVNLNSFSDNATNGSDNFDFNYLNSGSSTLNSSDNNGINYFDNYLASNSDYSNPFANYSDNDNYQSPNYSDGMSNYFNTLTSASSDNYLNNLYGNSDTNNLTPNYSDNVFNSYYSDSPVSSSDNSDIWNVASDNIPSNSSNPYSDNYNNQSSYSYSDLNNSNLFPNSSDSLVFSSSTSDSSSDDNDLVNSSSSIYDYNNIASSSTNSVSSDSISDNSSDISDTSGVPLISVDATHKYLIPDSNNQYIMLDSDVFSDVNNHELNSLYSDEKLNNVPLVHIINTKNLLGYQLNEISDVQPSDSDDVWVFSDELNNSNLVKFNDVERDHFNATLNNGYGTDATHKYLISGTNGKDITFSSINSDGNYSDYADSDNHALLFIKIINNKSVFGYHFDQIIMNLNDASDSSDVSKKWVFSDELNNSPKANVNDVQEFQNFRNTVMNHYYTPSEINRINEIKQRYNYLEQHENDSDNIFLVKPDLPNHQVGQLTNKFKQDVTDWVNFYRSLYGLKPVNDNVSYDLQAQYGADGCNALNGIEHGLGGMSSKPTNITSSDWQKGIDATDSSNLYGGGASDPSEIQGYFTDGSNLTGNNTGHRAWLLDQGLHNIGVGVDNGYGDLYVITPSDSSLTSSDEPNSSLKDITYPNAGVFPYSDAVSGPWSLYLPANSDISNNVSVSVHDDTVNVNLKVNDIELSSDYGYYSGIITYEPQNVKANHQYTIIVKGQGIPNGKYTYTTKLFN